jgi:alginate O-acetyltransferase complex protein AlgI
MLYISMFPQLIAGPIVRFNTIAAQISERRITMEARVNGFCRFIIGLGKKVLIANQMALLADPIFAMPYQEMATSTAWIGILAYTFQIYFDFSGYSDMAIGLGKMLGFRFPENFNAPYTSLSISEFWRRWHITLGAFMKNYLYIPLGGNRKGTLRTYLNLVTVFLLSGLWHGASWNFVLWGAFHGFFLIMDRIFMLKWLEKMGRFPAMILTFLAATSGWVLFRTETLSGAFQFYQAMFSFRGGIPVQWQPQICFLILAALISFAPATTIGQKMMEKLFSDHYSTKTLTLVVILILLIILPLSIGSLASNNFNPFIYFRF